MAGRLLTVLSGFLERSDLGRINTNQLLGLLSLYTLLNVVEYLQLNVEPAAVETSGQELQEIVATKANDPSIQKALSTVLGGAGNEPVQTMATLAKSLGKNPAAILSLLSLLAGEKAKASTEKVQETASK